MIAQGRFPLLKQKNFSFPLKLWKIMQIMHIEAWLEWNTLELGAGTSVRWNQRAARKLASKASAGPIDCLASRAN
jgi:hypothetical protein